MRIKNYRNIKKQLINISKKNIIIFGTNGCGKSNLCQVIYNEMSPYKKWDETHMDYIDNEEYGNEGSTDHKNKVKKLVIKIPAQRMFNEIEFTNFTIKNADKTLEFLQNFEYKLSENDGYDIFIEKLLNYYMNNETTVTKINKFLSKINENLCLSEYKEINKASDGTKNIIFIFCYLSVIEEILEGLDLAIRKTVIIDELDLNLHETAVISFSEQLRKTFNSWQFIITTHSVSLLNTFEGRNSIMYKIEEGLVKKVDPLFDKSVLEVLSEFGVSKYNSKLEKVHDELKKIIVDFWNNYEEGKDQLNKELIKEVKEKKDSIDESLWVYPSVSHYMEMLNEIINLRV